MEKLERKEADGETRCKSERKEEADGETSEKRSDVETEMVKSEMEMEMELPLSGMEMDVWVSNMEMMMEHSGQLVPTNNSMEEKKILIGKHIDVKGFLSSKNRDYLVSPKDGTLVPVSSLAGNYVLICCISIPFDLVGTSEASLCQSLEALYSHLSVIAISQFVKLVIVLKLKHPAPAAGASAFDSFFSWFPLNCLTIPFWDSHSRHSICHTLGLSPHFSCHPCLAIHPSGLVLLSDSSSLQFYGSRSFPFTRMHLDDITRHDNLFTHAICSHNNLVILQELLQCDRLSRVAAVDNQSLPISHLFNKPVGLYLYCDGYFMDDLRDLHKRCLEKRLHFDVVLVPLPFVEHYDPASFCNLMKQSALEDQITSSWWLFPFDDDICRTLWRLTLTDEDAFFILPHRDFRGDLDGRAVASRYGIDAYPFTKDALVKRKVNHLRSLTLDRLLGIDYTNMWDLQNKNVLLYFDYPSFESSSLYKLLKEGYGKIESKYPDCKIVLVPLKPPRFSNADAEIDWPILPSEKSETVINHIFTDQIVGTALVAFGKDGKLLSRFAGKCLPIHKSCDPLFGDTLHSEILEDVKKELLDYE